MCCISLSSSPAQPNPEELCIIAAVLLETVAEDIREYLRSRRDTIRCIVTMLTDDSAGGDHAEGETEGESLFEELKRTVADEVGQYTQPLLHKPAAHASTDDVCGILTANFAELNSNQCAQFFCVDHCHSSRSVASIA